MYVSFLSCRLRIHPSLLRDLPWSGPFHLDFHSGLPAAPPCRPGTPSTEQRSAPPPPPTRVWLGGWQAGCPCPPRLWAACPLLPAGTCWRPISATWRACGFALASVAVWSPAPRSPTDHGHGQRPPQQHQPETASAPVTHRTLLCLRTRDATPPSRQASAVSLHPFLLSDSCSLRCRLRPFDGR